MLQAELKVLGGKFQGKSIPLNMKRFLVGREQDCHLRPNSESVSRHHCVFTLDDYGVRLRDLGSTNGTRVNNELIKHETVLKDGDLIQIGKLELQLGLRTVEEPVIPSAPVAEFETTVGQSGSETSYEIPAFVPESAQTTTAFGGDTAIVGGGVPQPQMPPAPYGMPGYMPNMAPQGMPYGYPGYPSPGYGAPMMMPGYPPGYGMPQYAPQGYGMAPQQPPAAPAPVDDREAAALAAAAIPTKLPPPESTGVREPAPKPAAPAAAAGAQKEEIPSQSAADIIKQYMQRRTTR